jgi:hypothetical protein
VQGLTITDFVIMAVLCGAFALGWARGLVRILTGFVVFLVSMVVAGRYSIHVVEWLNRSWGAQDWLVALLERRITVPTEASRVPASAIPWERVLELLENLDLPISYKQELAEQISKWSEAAGNITLAKYLFQLLATSLLNGVVFVVIGLLLGWGLTLVGRLVSDQVQELPIVGTLNRWLGASAIAVQVTILLSFLVAVVVPMLSVYGFSFIDSVNKAQLTPYFVNIFQWIRALVFGQNTSFFFVK